MGKIQESLSKVFPKLSQYKLAVRIMICADLVWLGWVNIVKPGIDAAQRFEFVKSDWPSIISHLTTAIAKVGEVAGKPIAGAVVVGFGVGFLYLDRRFGSAPTRVPISTTPDELSSEKVEESDDESTTVPTEPTTKDEQPFPIAFEMGVTPIVKDSDGSLNIGDTKSSAGDALVAIFTNEDLSDHYVTARITYFNERRSVYERYGKAFRVIENPLWLGQAHTDGVHFAAGNAAYFVVHQTHYLVLAADNRPPHPRQLSSLEDHRLTNNSALGIEARALEPVKTSLEIELTIEGSRPKTFNVSVNFKTFRFSPKESAGVAETALASRLTTEKVKKS